MAFKAYIYYIIIKSTTNTFKFLQGRITDGKGNCIECKDATFILTANLGNDEIIKFGEDRLAKTHPKTVEGAMGMCVLTRNALNYRNDYFTRLKLCLATTTHNFK